MENKNINKSLSWSMFDRIAKTYDFLKSIFIFRY